MPNKITVVSPDEYRQAEPTYVLGPLPPVGTMERLVRTVALRT
jgi:hypothetical protein